jgi:hypothetical protein
MLESNQTAFSTVSMEAIHSAAAKLGAMDPEMFVRANELQQLAGQVEMVLALLRVFEANGGQSPVATRRRADARRRDLIRNTRLQEVLPWTNGGREHRSCRCRSERCSSAIPSP